MTFIELTQGIGALILIVFLLGKQLGYFARYSNLFHTLPFAILIYYNASVISASYSLSVSGRIGSILGANSPKYLFNHFAECNGFFESTSYLYSL